MISPQKSQAVQRMLLLGGVFLFLAYVLVYLPLCDRVAGLDKPLVDTWRAIQHARIVEASVKGVSSEPLEQRLREMEILSRRLAGLSNTLAARIAFDAAVRAKMRQPFQLVDYQNELQLNKEELQGLAAAQNVTLAPAALAGYPEYSADLVQPELLWGHLAVTHEALKLAVACQVSNIVSVSVRPPRPLGADESAPVFAYELPAQLQLVGTMPAITRFLASLPASAKEAKPSLGLPDFSASKPALFIDRILLRKEPPDKPNLVRLEVRLAGLLIPER